MVYNRRAAATFRLQCPVNVLSEKSECRQTGVPGGIRTHGPRIRNPVLYPAELRGPRRQNGAPGLYHSAPFSADGRLPGARERQRVLEQQYFRAGVLLIESGIRQMIELEA